MASTPHKQEPEATSESPFRALALSRRSPDSGQAAHEHDSTLLGSPGPPVANSLPPEQGDAVPAEQRDLNEPGHTQKEHSREYRSGPPAWLGIFFDISWTATFSNLTTNTKLTTVTYGRKSMLAISALFACTRGFLVLAYGRAAFAVVRLDLERSALPSRLCLWIAAIAIEIFSYLMVPEVDPGFLLNVDTMGERLSTLTSIILGEGLNSLAEAVLLGARTVAFNVKTVGVAASSTIIVAFAFLLYFDGLKDRMSFTHTHAKWNVMLHFLLHLALIVLMEAMKNTLLYSSLFGVFNATIHRAITPKRGESGEDAKIAAFWDIGLDIEQFMNQTEQAILAENATRPDTKLTLKEVHTEVASKGTAKIMLIVFDQFGLADNGFTTNVSNYIDTIGGDARSGTVSLMPLLDGTVARVQESARWILLAGAVFLACLGLLTLANYESWVHKHRYLWGSILSRWVTAVVLGLLTLLGTNTAKWQRLQDEALLGAIVAIAFIVQFAIDYGLLICAAWRQKRGQALGSHQQA
ncbi:hypothetical protein AURDEDRAFT_129509 [Auricularia subglabra TFB-10046 SS5]|uniref:Uncharacterized protein n=1 Tax=Auricularia subglabra (strain TFB-10046 / SS5) TaxID=717982 RepID=J0LHA3_AURST|nr:hypothetical protein AURDEDRAFT_129509 [Auricularia subglabra TFB-10046 SS5]